MVNVLFFNCFVCSKTTQILECLEDSINKLSPKCHRIVFNIEQHDLTDSSSDYTLLSTCKRMFKLYCDDQDTSQALSCLKVR